MHYYKHIQNGGVVSISTSSKQIDILPYGFEEISVEEYAALKAEFDRVAAEEAAAEMPTMEERMDAVEAQVFFTAMMTDTMMEDE